MLRPRLKSDRLLDGLYALRTSVPAKQLDDAAAVAN
jgi:hypothetical protein